MTICSICTVIGCEKRKQEMNKFTASLVGTKYDDKREMCVDGCVEPNCKHGFCYGCVWFDVHSRVCGKVGEVVGKGKDDLDGVNPDTDEHRVVSEGAQVSHVPQDVGRMIEHLKEMGKFYTNHSCDYSVNYGYLKALEDVIAWLEKE